MVKKKNALPDIVGESSLSERKKKRLEMAERLEMFPEMKDKTVQKRRTMFYLSESAIDALADIEYFKKKQAPSDEKSGINKSTIVEKLILAEKEKIEPSGTKNA